MRTDFKPSPYMAFATVRIASSLPADQLANRLEHLFRNDLVLREALPCHRYGIDNARLSCTQLIGKDAFSARFDMESRAVVLALAPTTYDPGYRPDYEHFERLKAQVVAMLKSHFGDANVTVE